MDIYVSGNIAYVYVMDDGLQIIDISNPANPQFVSHLKLPYHTSFQMQKENNHLYFSAFNPSSNLYEIQIVDISNPQDPELIGNYKQSGIDIGIFYLSNNLLFLPLDKLEIIDVSNPLSPLKIGEYNIDSVYDICFSEDKAYILTESDGMSILDISTPETPILFKKYLNINGFYISIDGNYAIISNWSTIHVYDNSNSSDISLLSSIAADELVDHLVCDDVIYYHSYGSRIGTVDFSNPNSLSSIDLYYVIEGINEMCVVDHIFYIAADDNGMLILDMSDPLNPLRLSIYDIYLPFVRNRNIILITASATVLAGIIGILIWRREKVSIKSKHFLTRIKQMNPATVVFCISSIFCTLSIISIIIACSIDALGVGLVLMYTLGPIALAIVVLAPLITLSIVRVRKQKVISTDDKTHPISEDVHEQQEDSIFCPNCGTQNKRSSNHCSNCEFKL